MGTPIIPNPPKKSHKGSLHTLKLNKLCIILKHHEGTEANNCWVYLNLTETSNHKITQRNHISILGLNGYLLDTKSAALLSQPR